MQEKTDSSSSPDTQVRVVMVTFPTIEVARQVGTHAIQQRLAACVNLIPAIESIYQWQSQVQHDPEVLAIFKTACSQVVALQDAVLRLHPYDVPEFLVLPVHSGSPAYLDWILDNTHAASAPE